MMGFEGCPSDANFGPIVQGCRDEFDFTLKFERIFFSLVPASLFIVISAIWTVRLTRKPLIVRGYAFQAVKVTALIGYAALQIPIIVLATSGAGTLTTLFVSSSVVNLLAALCMIVLSVLEHARSLRPSILLNIYLFLTILFDIAQTRSLILAASGSASHAFAYLFTATTALKAVVILTESRQKTAWLTWDIKEQSPEDTSGVFSLGTYFWLNSLFLRGYKQVLTVQNLPPLGPTMASEALGERLEAQLQQNSRTKGQKLGLAKALSRVLLVPLLLPVIPRMALVGFNFCQPFIINSVLSYLTSQEPVKAHNANIGYGLIGATIIVYIGIAVSNAFYRYFHERALWMARGALANAIYRKATRAQLSAAGSSASLTLMSTDIERIRVGFQSFHDFWASIIEVALALWFLFLYLGTAFVAPIIIVVVCMICITLITGHSGKWQMAWMQKIQKRVGLTSSVIANMKHLKISGLAEPVQLFIQQLRIDEINAGRKWRMVIISAFVIGFSPSILAPVFSFAFTAHSLDVTRIFTSLSFLTLLTNPLTQLFQFIPSLLAAFTCLGRIQTFLEDGIREDFRNFASATFPEKSTTNTSVTGGVASVIEVKHGSFGWVSENPTLSALNFKIPKSGLTMVIGPVASGKSTLCNALIGETPVYGGEMNVSMLSRPVGYCAQVPFLVNGTIRENIIGHTVFDSERYKEVVAATMLLPDFTMLPEMDNTKVGSNGITLSGGQKQRVCLARALYLGESDLLIFDDIFSGLDAGTEEQIFQRVFGPLGLVRRRGATAIICTHSVRHLPFADHIIALGPDGRLVEQGEFDDLDANGIYVPSLNVSRPSTTGTCPDPLLQPSTDDTIVEVENDATLTIAEEAKINSSARLLDPTEEHDRRIGETSVYKHYAKSIKLPTLIAFALVNIGVGFFWNFPQIWLNYWSADVTAPSMAHSEAFWVGLYALFSILCLVFVAISGVIVLIAIISQSGKVLHHRALHTVINAPLQFFTKTDVGVVTNLFSQDITLIDTELPQALLNLSISLFVLIGMIAVITTSSPYIAIGYPFLVALLWAIQRFYLRTSRQLRLLDLEAKSPLYTHFMETLNGVTTLRAFGWISHSLSLNNKLLDNSQRPAYLLSMIQHWLTLTLNLVVAALAAVVVIIATQVTSTGAGFTGASLVTLMTLGDIITLVIQTYTSLETSIGAVSRLKSFSDKVLPETLPEETKTELPRVWPFSGGIEIRGISAAYYDPNDHEMNLESNSSDLAINDLSLSIKAGEKVALCGRSGSGKSSIILLLLRLLNPIPSCMGSITIDGIPLHQVDRSLLRQRIIALSQDPIFLPDGTSIRENLDPFGKSSDDECFDVLGMVGLGQFIANQGGLDQGFLSGNLSQGQKQLLSLARVVLRRRIHSREAAVGLLSDSPQNRAMDEQPSLAGGILLLDEMNSSVDQEMDRTMQSVIKSEFADYTIVSVSHRLEMVMSFDTVVVMDRGRLVESGNPRELVEQDGSYFHALWAAGEGQA